MIEKEPVTVVCSEKGWIRAMKGHMADVSGLTFKEGDKGEFTFHAMTTDKVMLFSTAGKFFTLDVGKLPGGRGHGEPVRLMCDLDAADSIVALFVHAPGPSGCSPPPTATASSCRRTSAWPTPARASRC